MVEHIFVRLAIFMSVPFWTDAKELFDVTEEQFFRMFMLPFWMSLETQVLGLPVEYDFRAFLSRHQSPRIIEGIEDQFGFVCRNHHLMMARVGPPDKIVSRVFEHIMCSP